MMATSTMAGQKHLKAKVCLVGDVAVGKTSLIKRFVQDQFDDRYISTLGAKVSKKAVKVDGTNGGVEVDMIIWDIIDGKGVGEGKSEEFVEGRNIDIEV